MDIQRNAATICPYAELSDALTRTHGNVSEVARAMGKTRMQIHRWMKRFNITPESFRG